MRSLALLVLISAANACYAQQSPLEGCIAKLESDSRFSTLRNKLALGPTARASPNLAANVNMPTDKERTAIKNWSTARKKCVDEAQGEGNAVYRPPLVTYAIEAERQVLAAAAELYDRKISYGDFQRQREDYNEQMQRKVVGLRRQIQNQNSAFAESDARARERQLLQKDVDEAERLASIAQQQAQNPSPPPSNQTQYRRYPSFRPDAENIGPYRNCVNLGTRVVCSAR
ncbi:MAG: hypothetical protein JWN94_1217 [Betaproteobacteria bacterium]|nr:hypothetical protein [Betaproteobacteria bacterium]